MDRQTDGRKDRKMDGQTGRQTEGKRERCTKTDLANPEFDGYSNRQNIHPKNS